MNFAEKMFAGDKVLSHFGAELIEVGDGIAHVRMTITEDMVQAHGTCHGGIIYTLADATFGVACNSGSVPAVAQHCSISYLKPAQIGDILSIKVQKRTEVGRTGLYDGTILQNDSTPIAEFRGHSRSSPPRKS